MEAKALGKLKHLSRPGKLWGSLISTYSQLEAMVNIEEIFSNVSEKMLLDFNQTKIALEHSGQKGSANEETVRDFMRQYLPKSLDISTGILIDRTGKKSKQLDIIVSDAAKTPILYENAGIRVIPAECAYCVIEVKALLNANELEACYQNMKSVKMLIRDSYYWPNGPIEYYNNLYGQEWREWPIHYFVFSYQSINLETLTNTLNARQAADAIHQRIDLACALSQGVIINHKEIDGGFSVSTLPEPGSTMKFVQTDKSLLLFYVLMANVLNQAKMDPFNIKPYLGNINF